MRVGALAGIIGIVSASGTFGGDPALTGEVVIAEGSAVELDGCVVEVAHTCDGPEGRLVALSEDCGENPDMLGMGLLEGDCVALGTAVYCVERVVVGQGVAMTKRYDTVGTRLQSGDVLRGPTR